MNWRNMGFLRYVARTLLMPHGLKGNQVLPIILPRSRDNDSFRDELVELEFIPENVTVLTTAGVYSHRGFLLKRQTHIIFTVRRSSGLPDTFQASATLSRSIF